MIIRNLSELKNLVESVKKSPSEVSKFQIVETRLLLELAEKSLLPNEPPPEPPHG